MAGWNTDTRRASGSVWSHRHCRGRARWGGGRGCAPAAECRYGVSCYLWSCCQTGVCEKWRKRERERKRKKAGEKVCICVCVCVCDRGVLHCYQAGVCVCLWKTEMARACAHMRTRERACVYERTRVSEREHMQRVHVRSLSVHTLSLSLSMSVFLSIYVCLCLYPSLVRAHSRARCLCIHIRAYTLGRTHQGVHIRAYTLGRTH